MNAGSLTINILKHTVEMEDGYRYPISKQLFLLYTYLALKRVEETPEGGFVTKEQIRLLSLWKRNNPLSVGKQIRREIIRMEKLGRNIIDFQDKVKGKFRLGINPSQIAFDVSKECVQEFLGLSSLSTFYDDDQEERLYQYSEAMCRGDISLNKGRFSKALLYFERALGHSAMVQEEISTLLGIGRVLERQGRYDEAIERLEKAIKRLKDNRSFDHFNLANLYNYAAWIYHRRKDNKDIKLAEAYYRRALNLIEGETHYELLGQIYNGLGIVYEARNLYEEATRYYKNALGYSSLARNVYGIQAAYFNIGNMHSKFGDVALYSAKTGISLVAKDNYNTSITWVRRCMELCKRAGIGGDTCQDRILLAYCWYKLRNFREALKYATEAVKIATRVGNKRDRRIAQRLLEDITSEMRMKDKG